MNASTKIFMYVYMWFINYATDAESSLSLANKHFYFYLELVQKNCENRGVENSISGAIKYISDMNKLEFTEMIVPIHSVYYLYVIIVIKRLSASLQNRDRP